MVSSLNTIPPRRVSTTRSWTELVAISRPKIEKIQRRIYRESRNGNLRSVHSLQRLLSTSFSAKIVAVNKATTSSGSHTPGIDGKLYISTQSKKALAIDMNLKKYHPLPTRRVKIPKPDGSKRILGIPTIKDRAYQSLVLLAMEPQWEARFEPNSYGFRPGRNAHQAIKSISKILHTNVKQYGTSGPIPIEKADHVWILDADISKCFDNINHNTLLQKIHPSPFYSTIQKWLQMGTITEIGFRRTTKGTPQGGIISPLLANIALHGLEELFGIYTEETKEYPPKRKRYLPPSARGGQNKHISVIRYADDFIVITRASSNYRIREFILPRIKEFLRTVGLTINQVKTKVVNIKEGFNFLGFKFRFRKDLNDTTYWPEKSRIDRALCKLNKYILSRTTISNNLIPNLIAGINRRVQGIIRYYGWSRAWGSISYLGHRLWWLMFKWGLRRHRKRGKKWVRAHYFTRKPWETFAFNNIKVTVPYLYWRSMTKVNGWWDIKQIKINLSPFDEEW
jgi:RNA-directed DNA polymerase